jgi:hypothetical protein
MTKTTYYSINPETGEPTKDHEFVNSWKWGEPERLQFRSESEYRNTLCDRYDLPRDTPFEAIEEVRRLKKKVLFHSENYKDATRQVTEFLEVLEKTSFQIKSLEEKQKKILKEKKEFLKDIKPYLTHKQDCFVTIMELVGRTKIKSKCNCGLSDLLDQRS